MSTLAAKLLMGAAIAGVMLGGVGVFALMQTWLFIPAGLVLFGLMMFGVVKP